MVTISQTTYLRKVLTKFTENNTLNPVSTPMQPEQYLLKSKDKADTHLQMLYATIIGAILYTAICTQPDLSYAVQNLSQFMSSPVLEHWTAVK